MYASGTHMTRFFTCDAGFHIGKACMLWKLPEFSCWISQPADSATLTHSEAITSAKLSLLTLAYLYANQLALQGSI